MKFLLILLLAIPTFAQVKTDYDKFKDQTIVASETVRLGKRNDGLSMAVKGLHKGEKLLTGDLHSYLVFWSSSPSWRFLNSRDLIFLADGERISLGKGSHSGDVSGSHYVHVTETLIYNITREDLEKLAKAASVEMKLGYIETKLDVMDARGFKDILTYK